MHPDPCEVSHSWVKAPGFLFQSVPHYCSSALIQCPEKWLPWNKKVILAEKPFLYSLDFCLGVRDAQPCQGEAQDLTLHDF